MTRPHSESISLFSTRSPNGSILSEEIDSQLLSDSIAYDSPNSTEDSTSDSSSTPLTPWTLRMPSESHPKKHRGSHQRYNSTPHNTVNNSRSYAQHIERQQSRPRSRSGVHFPIRSEVERPQTMNYPSSESTEGSDKHGVNSRQKARTRRYANHGMYQIPISRDFFLIIALCFGIACSMICIVRPAFFGQLQEPLELI
ncbi:hypothetical protein BDQ12DRAFT_676683 [Crucibulum laeve]|uniref:Uncharacterized protein n=1 Tax=Crucibulum laeve TaxID=68775 RepID=A0A5C3MD79_9AGAR|nr:hypothetical protein BDQ12DRAFT_676683 [Crucibulum laeve]